MSRSIAYTSSPLLASRTPVWRSKFVVAAIALGFVGLAARAVYIQVIANDFFRSRAKYVLREPWSCRPIVVASWTAMV